MNFSPLTRRSFMASLAALSAHSALRGQQAPAPPTALPQGGPPDVHAGETALGLTGPANPALPSLILVGDSTVRNGYGTGSDGLWGWGAPIAKFFDPAKVNVVNRAIGGLSSHTYISQGHWDSTLALMKAGDVVLIQFGHNDGGVTLPGHTPVPDQGLLPGQVPPPPPDPNKPPRPLPPPGRGSLPGTGEETLEIVNPRTQQHEQVHTFGWYLRRYVADARAKGATPILCSLVPRKLWLDGHIIRNTSTYRGWTREVAEHEHVGFIDLNEIVAECYDDMGQAAVDPLFGDPHTHTTLAGAELNAKCVIVGFTAMPKNPVEAYFSAEGKAFQPWKLYERVVF